MVARAQCRRILLRRATGLWCRRSRGRCMRIMGMMTRWIGIWWAAIWSAACGWITGLSGGRSACRRAALRQSCCLSAPWRGPRWFRGGFGGKGAGVRKLRRYGPFRLRWGWFLSDSRPGRSGFSSSFCQYFFDSPRLAVVITTHFLALGCISLNLVLGSRSFWFQLVKYCVQC